MELMRLERVAVDGRLAALDLHLAAGKMLGLIGPNGAGKSTLLHCMAGIQAHAGRIELAGEELARLPPMQRARRIGFLPQASHSAWALSVADVVALGRLPWNDSDAAAIDAAMHATGVAAWRARRVDRLSGGEQARVWLARVLAGQPRLLLADEPIASLDLRHQLRVMELLRAHARPGHGTILSLHDLGLAARYCDKLCLLQDGRVHAFGTPAEVLTAANLRTVFEIEAHIDLRADPPIVLPR